MGSELCPPALIQTLPHRFVTLGKIPNLLVLYFPNLQNGSNGEYLPHAC